MRFRTVRLVAGLCLCLGVTPSLANAQGAKGAAEQSVKTRFGSYELVSPRVLETALRSEELVLINVHTPYDGELPGTDLFIPFDKIALLIAKMLPDKTSKIAVYCVSGRMSEIAAKTLVKLGYTEVTDLQGGMIAWQRAGYARASH